ncbi:pyridoxal phosphate-dependent aminotransferase [soil metagenome]
MTTSIVSETRMDFPINPNVQKLKPSATLAVNERSKELAQQGKEIYRLGFGQSPFPVPDSVVKTLRENAFQKDYLPTKGLPELRTAVAGFHQHRHDFSVSAEDIFIGPGSKELMFILQLIWQGTILIPSPSWVSYEPQAKLLGRKAVWLPAEFEDGWRLMPETLEEFCRENPNEPYLLILNYPGNPTGVTYSADLLEEIAQVVRKYKILVLSDEIYGELNYSGRHISLAKFYPEGTIVSGGLSKWCGAGGWRLGTFCFPPNLRRISDLMASVASETFSAVSAPIQYAAVTAFEPNDEIENYLIKTRKILSRLGNTIAGRLQDFGIRTALPEGGFYLFPDFSNFADKLREKGITNSPQFCEKLLTETGVALLPGADFGRPSEELTCRLAYVDFDGAKCLENFSEQSDENFLEENCGKVLKAVDLIGLWSADGSSANASEARR